jgi:hypothetical protein
MENWRLELQNFLYGLLGSSVKTEYISGIAGSGCVRVESLDKSVVVKVSNHPRERLFYEKHAESLRACNVAVPELYFSGCDADGMHYIVIEYIPHPLPQTKWIRNMQQVKMLFALHYATWGERRPDVEVPYCPAWTEEMTDRVFAWFARSTEADLILGRLRRGQALWQRMNFTCCISADPNPTNWRVRDDGTLVLVDWERFGYGTPAIDLAILMPGFGSQDGSLERWLAEAYVQCWHEAEGFAPMSPEVLQAQIRLAKLWSVIEFIAGAATNSESYPKDTVQHIVENLPSALQQIELIGR